MNLGDHGVRKYEYETGRFISIDPLWSNYFGWTPYQYSMNSPVMLVDQGGENAVAIVDKQSESIVIKATYVVNGSIYSLQNSEDMKVDINKSLNEAKHSVSEGFYSGYSVSYDLDFVYSSEESFKMADSYNYGDINIGNSIGIGSKSTFKDKLINNYDGIRMGTVGGKTENHRDILMNPSRDTKINRIHEIFHTLFYDNDGAASGIGKYGQSEMPNQKDINGLINNENLPKVIK